MNEGIHSQVLIFLYLRGGGLSTYSSLPVSFCLSRSGDDGSLRAPLPPLGDTRTFSDVIACLQEEAYVLRERNGERIANFPLILLTRL